MKGSMVHLKKAMALFIASLMIFTLLSGCGTAKNSALSSETKQQESKSQEQAASSERTTDTAKNEPVKIGFSFGQSVHPFFIAMEKGARDAAKKNNVELIVTSAEYKVENQVANVEDLLQQGIKALLINPVDSKALANVVNEANSKGVPVFTVDIAVTGGTTAAHVASDNVEIGRMAARYIIKKLNGKGNIGLIGLQTVSSTLDREKGFMEEINKQDGVKVVANQGNGMERDKALVSAENILQANPDIDAIFGVNESSAMGALSAVDARDLKDIFIVGVDATPDLLNSIRQKTAITATIAQNPYKMGEVALELALKKIKGEDVPQSVPVETDEVTIDNVDKYIAREAEYKK